MTALNQVQNARLLFVSQPSGARRVYPMGAMRAE